jgi:hypothetical protein
VGIFEHGSLEKLTEREPCKISPSSASANAVMPRFGVHSNAHLVSETLDAGGSEEEEVVVKEEEAAEEEEAEEEEAEEEEAEEEEAEEVEEGVVVLVEEEMEEALR